MKNQTFGRITVFMDLQGAVDGILNNYGKPVVQLRQTVTTVTEYEEREGNSRQDGLAGISAKVGGATYTNESVRTTLFAIAPGVTAAQVQAAIDELQKDGDQQARLYQVLSSDVITTKEQDYRIGQGVLSKDTLAETQITRPKGGGDPIVKDGQFIFRQCFFSATPRPDEDESAMAEAYVPAAYAHMLTPSLALVSGSAAENERETARENGAPALVEADDVL